MARTRCCEGCNYYVRHIWRVTRDNDNNEKAKIVKGYACTAEIEQGLIKEIAGADAKKTICRNYFRAYTKKGAHYE